jgi:small subunit ribosomal protein S17
MAEEPQENVGSPEVPDADAASEAQGDSGTEGAAEALDASASEAASASDAQASPVEALPPKQRRRGRAAKAAVERARPRRSPEQRQAERDAERRRKGQVRSTRRKRERDKARASATPTAEPLAPRREQHPGRQKTRQGIVVSDRASKTIVVRIDVTRRHPSYQKVVRTSTTLHAHDEGGDAHIGDTVIVRESRPLSRTKRWRLVEVLERAK